MLDLRKRMFECQFCGEEFETPLQLAGHKRKHPKKLRAKRADKGISPGIMPSSDSAAEYGWAVVQGILRLGEDLRTKDQEITNLKNLLIRRETEYNSLVTAWNNLKFRDKSFQEQLKAAQAVFGEGSLVERS